MSDAFRPADETDVYAVFGVEPEVQAYAMAKYSRSALSLRESLKELSAQKAESFLNTFYFQYGHRSIADLAHIAFAIEKLSLLAAIELEDEQRWDGQERSTRYQDFSKKSYYRAEFADQELTRLYRQTIDFLFDEYGAVSQAMFEYLVSNTPKPAEMKQEQYERTLRARAFDIARYMLPLATNTSVGQIVNARTLETQVSRLLTSRYPEVRTLGEKLKKAAKEPAYDVNRRAYEALIAELADLPDLAQKFEGVLLKGVAPSPTLVKYAEANPYLAATREELAHAAAELMDGAGVEGAPLVDLLEDDPVEVELATTLLYEQCHYSYRQIRRAVESLAATQRKQIIDLGTKHRGRHDEVLRAYCSGQKFRFDILMDVGGFRDMHRHRRCTQIHQGYTFAHGYDTPEEIRAAGLGARYDAAMTVASDAASKVATPEAAYMLPLAYRKRTLFKMDLAEAIYITEIRSTPAGHFSYRRVAWEMFRAVAERHPELESLFRVRDVNEPVDLLQR